jgi:CubicO group peptidase (beta-lactamase class C family)
VKLGTREPADAAAETLPQVDAVLRAAVTSQDVPGVVAMAATETGLVYEGVFGSRRIHEGPAMTRDTIFRVASMVKLITSVAALRAALF